MSALEMLLCAVVIINLILTVCLVVFTVIELRKAFKKRKGDDNDG